MNKNVEYLETYCHRPIQFIDSAKPFVMFRKLLRRPLVSCLLFFPFIPATLHTAAVPPASHRPDNPVFILVIDPGHGGIDVGAAGKYSYEKNVALDVGLKLGKLAEQLPDVKVVYTRTTDELPGDPQTGTNKQRIVAALKARANIANKSHGNLFISIHCNSAPPARHRELVGHKTVYVRVHGKRVKRSVPRYRYYTTPNPANGTETYVWGIDKNSDKDLALKENGPLAEDPELKALIGDDGSPEGQIMVSMVRHEFMKQSLDMAANVEEQFAKVGRVNREVRQRQVGIWVLHATAMPSILVETGFISNPTEEDYLNHHQDEIAHSIFLAFVRYLAQIRGVTIASLLQSGGMTESSLQVPAPPKANMTYKIQLMSSDTPYQPNDPRFSKLDGVLSMEKTTVDNDDVYRYLLGNFDHYEDANDRLDKIKLMGYKDAFVVTYQNGKRMDN